MRLSSPSPTGDQPAADAGAVPAPRPSVPGTGRCGDGLGSTNGDVGIGPRIGAGDAGGRCSSLPAAGVGEGWGTGTTGGRLGPGDRSGPGDSDQEGIGEGRGEGVGDAATRVGPGLDAGAEAAGCGRRAEPGSDGPGGIRAAGSSGGGVPATVGRMVKVRDGLTPGWPVAGITTGPTEGVGMNGVLLSGSAVLPIVADPALIAARIGIDAVPASSATVKR
ncbi:hypothetical protein GA0070624_1009 [Micromonospora rhizosphaerae]|uniref:Uncharacterized protein n=1 Tax=Micromonospora rhizosphaerae TaxID=568872 RepID=A0A1C6RH90_9ACTN|nr:hypothetical protein GA0070624_1009 [Micromonospora rhizosphaerae]